MKLAIVGSSRLSEPEEINARKFIALLIHTGQKEYPDFEILTGDAEGVDKLVRDIALEQRVDYKVFCSQRKSWKEQGGFRDRNIRLAKECDEIVSLVTVKKSEDCYHHEEKILPHQRSGGCWTMEYANSYKNHKIGRFIIL